MEEDPIRATVQRLARPHSSGGAVIERAAIMAVGGSSAEVLAWITAHEGRPESATPVAGRPRGLHSARLQDDGNHAGLPQRYVLPPGALS